MTTLVAASIGGVVGSILTAVANFFLQRQQDERRWQREDRVSLRQDRLRIYQQVMVSLDASQDGRFPYGEKPYAFSEALAPAVAEMKLISSERVVNAAERAISAAQYREHLSMKDAYGEKVDDAALRLEQAVEEFIESVRQELGLPKEEQEPQLVTTRLSTEQTGG